MFELGHRNENAHEYGDPLNPQFPTSSLLSVLSTTPAISRRRSGRCCRFTWPIPNRTQSRIKQGAQVNKMIRAASARESSLTFVFISTSLLSWDFALSGLLEANQAPWTLLERIGPLIHVIGSRPQVLHGVIDLVVVRPTRRRSPNPCVPLLLAKLPLNELRYFRSKSV